MEPFHSLPLREHRRGGGVAGNCSAASAKVAYMPHCRPIFVLKHSAVTMSARKHASQWTCRAPARDAGKAKSYQSVVRVCRGCGRLARVGKRGGGVAAEALHRAGIHVRGAIDDAVVERRRISRHDDCMPLSSRWCMGLIAGRSAGDGFTSKEDL